MHERALQLPCGARLSNRLAKAALTERLSDEDLGPSPALLQLYSTWAELSGVWHELRLALSPRNLPPRRPSSPRRA
jgi:2,4-dienoyl-CoA reductase-like NADH-dependent reductase (Old Yellow Enzyme family)